MMLAELIHKLGGRCEFGGTGPEITGVELDSRRVQAGDLFVALRGATSDGRDYIPQALAAGASAVLVQEPPDSALLRDWPQVPIWLHGQAAEVAGRAAACVLDDPSRQLAVFAVTGTNGKTTTAHLIGELLRATGRVPAVLGTTGYRLAGGEFIRASHTTPDAPQLQRLLARHRNAGGDCVVLEVSSHALTQQRVAGLDIDFAVFTNLSRDHLDYHGDMQHYAAAKSLMFSKLDSHAHALLNHDDEWSPLMADAARKAGCTVASYSAISPCSATSQYSAVATADLCASDLRFEPDATYLTLSGMGISLARLRIPLSGRFNVSNALAAAAAVLVSGASPSAVVEGLASVSPPPGRLEPVLLEPRRTGDAPRVFVDYAHTPDALRKVLETLREVGCADDGRLVCVFGCGGDRDQGKRAEMGRAASELADLAIVTSDNPRREDPARIIEDIRAGMSGPAEVTVQPDRRSAIRTALREARAGDTVLIAGKGHETHQTLGDRAIEFDDRVVAREEWS